MYKLCKTEQSAARQRELEAGLLQAMMLKRYDEISISDLCEQMNIPRKSFYRYFSSKDGALHALLDHTLLEYERVADDFVSASKKDPTTFLERYFQYWFNQKTLLDALEKSELSSMLVERAISQALQENQVPKHYLPGDTKAMRAHAIAFAITGLMSMVIQWHHTGYRESPREMAQTAAMILTRPLIGDRK